MFKTTFLSRRLRPKAEDHNQHRNQRVKDQYQDYFCLETMILVSRRHHCGVCVCVFVCLLAILLASNRTCMVTCAKFLPQTQTILTVPCRTASQDEQVTYGIICLFIWYSVAASYRGGATAAVAAATFIIRSNPTLQLSNMLIHADGLLHLSMVETNRWLFSFTFGFWFSFMNVSCNNLFSNALKLYIIYTPANTRLNQWLHRLYKYPFYNTRFT